MKIYFFTSKLDFVTAGGSVEEFDLMIRTLQKLGNEVVAVTAFSEANKITEPLPYQVIEESIPRRTLIGSQRGICALFKKYEHDADFFHVDGHNFLYGAGAYRRFGGRVPVSAFFNRELGSWPPDRSTLITNPEPFPRRLKRGLRWIVERYIGMPLANGIDVRAFISPMYQKMYEDFGLRCTGNCMVLGDPIDLRGVMHRNGVNESSYRARTSHNRPIQLFFSSRMVAGKGFDLILAGFARVKNKDRFRLILGGDGPEQPKIKKMAKDLGILAHINFPGWTPKEKLFELYKTADVFIQVGWRPEGTSISLLYALAFGLPMIVPRNTGLAWQAGEAAITVENGNHDELALAIEKLGEDAELRKRLSRNCYSHIADEQLDYEKVILKWFRMMQNARMP
ncbi:MAG: glycosyltransferase family 4 protein [bacterium]|nr:glycosyltransferase family 4 protein [bacterium]